MAGATNCATFCFLAVPAAKLAHTPTATPHKFRLKPRLVSSTSTPFPPKPTHRKNHLRAKILKTLAKPFPTTPLPQIETPIPTSPQPEYNDTVSEPPFNEIPTVEEAVDTEELRLSETIGEQGGSVGKFSAKFGLQFAFYSFGALVVCAFLFTGGSSSDEEKGRNVITLRGKEKVFMDKDGNLVYFDESQMEERINEIRAMAREVRESEKQGLDEEVDEESDIEKEIGARLIKLEERLKSKEKKVPGSVVDYFGWFGIGDDELSKSAPSSKVDNGNPSMDMSSSSSLEESRDSGGVDMRDANGGGNLKTMGSGSVHETSQGTSSIDAKQPHESRNMETDNSQLLGIKNKATVKVDKPTSVSSDGSSVHEKRSPVNKVGDRNSMQTDLWWLKLRYVLAILMRGDAEDGGFYSLRISEAGCLEDASYTVAFEDRGDANSFCCLLDSFLEDVYGFSANIVPLSVKDLHDEVKSHSKKVLVVKKRQLKLYTGQPFEEVEMALRSLIVQNQNVA
ncbi:hypothetical protein Tsubulata_016266 [Turnera subulata]|uniref:Uncharacterized protein n=1 Tax=Turnera subulata TaxID=218843 RepID=A0A9Q0FMF4_9ROSI|nr:hypothetical protein Tsubulata_016266 [Turnera subulata]